MFLLAFIWFQFAPLFGFRAFVPTENLETSLLEHGGVTLRGAPNVGTSYGQVTSYGIDWETLNLVHYEPTNITLPNDIEINGYYKFWAPWVFKKGPYKLQVIADGAFILRYCDQIINLYPEKGLTGLYALTDMLTSRQLGVVYLPDPHDTELNEDNLCQPTPAPTLAPTTHAPTTNAPTIWTRPYRQ
eukprot:797723_1